MTTKEEFRQQYEAMRDEWKNNQEWVREVKLLAVHPGVPLEVKRAAQRVLKSNERVLEDLADLDASFSADEAR